MSDWHFDARTSNSAVTKVFKRLARSFAARHRDYLKFYTDKKGKPIDIGWFYNERPNIGFLAAAAWRIPGWIALEEFTTKKRVQGKAHRGRADLYIGVPRGNHFWEIAIESKLAWVGTERSVRAALNPKNKKSKLALAIKDAKRISTNAHYRIATVFFCPRLRAENWQETFKQTSETFWDACGELKKHDFYWVAFSFVPKVPAVDSLEEKTKWAYPAVAVVMVDVG
jgi:hypothetical protein